MVANDSFCCVCVYNVQRCGFMWDKNKYAIYQTVTDEVRTDSVAEVQNRLNNVEHFNQQILFWDFLDYWGEMSWLSSRAVIVVYSGSNKSTVQL